MIATKSKVAGQIDVDGCEAAAPIARLSYVLITPARDESAFIEKTILSVVAQTALPVKWVIVSDGSTDGTDEIVRRYQNEHPWIELLQMPERQGREFAAKAHAFNAGYERVKGLPFDIIGNLDADITFGRDYFEFLLGKFAVDSALGVAGTPFLEDHQQPDKHTYAHRFVQLEHVSGACQLFRRSCFAQIGGYKPIKGGAIDWIAVTTARMNGWTTRTFTDKVCFHHRKIGTGDGASWLVRFRYGQKAYYVGGHPCWAFLRGVFQMREKPWFIGGLLFECGYWWSFVTRIERPVSKELIAFHRGEQMRRLRLLAYPCRNTERLKGS
jgi:glycosyltransferase involved in cell wall biosynthesis